MRNILKIYSQIGIWLIISTLLLGFAIHKNTEQPIYLKKFNNYFIIGYEYKIVLYNENKIIWEKSYTYPINNIDVFGNNIYMLFYNKITVLSFDGKNTRDILLNDSYDLFAINSSYIFLYKQNTLTIIDKFNTNTILQSYIINNISQLIRTLKDDIYIITKHSIMKLQSMGEVNILNTENTLLYAYYNNGLYVSQGNNIIYFYNDSINTIFDFSIKSPFAIDSDTIIFIKNNLIKKDLLK